MKQTNYLHLEMERVILTSLAKKKKFGSLTIYLLRYELCHVSCRLAVANGTLAQLHLHLRMARWISPLLVLSYYDTSKFDIYAYMDGRYAYIKFSLGKANESGRLFLGINILKLENIFTKEPGQYVLE